MPDQPTYTWHARLRMRQRRIRESDVEAVLDRYHTRYHDRDGNTVLVGRPRGQRVKIVVAKDSDPPRIITVMD